MIGKPPEPSPRIAYDIVEAARQVSVSDDTLRAAIRDGQLVARMVGRKYLIRHADLCAWVDGLPKAAAE